MLTIDDEYTSLPGSPRWDKVGFRNYDCQPDLDFCREKRFTFRHGISTLLQPRSYGETRLEKLVGSKRAGLAAARAATAGHNPRPPLAKAMAGPVA